MSALSEAAESVTISTVGDGPVLWVAGSESDYVSEAQLPLMSQLFPRVELRTVQGAGHWVHSEKPEEFEQLLHELID